MSLIIAIDGPAASGKSSVAKGLARRLGILFVNSGAMYRAVTWSVAQAGIDPADKGAVIAHLNSINIECGLDGLDGTVLIDGVDPGDALVSEVVNDTVSAVASIPEIRATRVAKQRDYTKLGSLVMEGRDIGSVVFPDTLHKFYIDANEDVRRQRREAQGLTDDPTSRDKQDSTRKASPLKVADNATVIDSSYLTIEQVIDRVIEVLDEQSAQK
jgi:cytidylate kinase